jgi:hypothetical protein
LRIWPVETQLFVKSSNPVTDLPLLGIVCTLDQPGEHRVRVTHGGW